jgi:DNA-binding transcriptional LysR family regulator
MLQYLPHELLRTLVEVADGGGHAQGALRVHLSQAAVSLQLKRLEELAGQPLFRKVGRRQALTTAGDTLLEYARRILALNAEAAEVLRGGSHDGMLRLGAPQDLAEELLPRILQRFSERFPRVQLDVRIDRNQALAQAIKDASLDLVLLLGDRANTPGLHLAKVNTVWLASKSYARSRTNADQPISLVLLEPPCLFRTRALAALDAAGLKYRISYTTSSLTGLRAAVIAGLGITARIQTNTDREFALVAVRSGLPALKANSVLLWMKPQLNVAGQALAESLGAELRGFR